MSILQRLRDWLAGPAPANPGEGTGRQGPWAHPEQRHGEQQGDVRALEVEGDPRGGAQSDVYRHADPRQLVVEDGAAMMGPGGAPVGDLEAADGDEQRARPRSR